MLLFAYKRISMHVGTMNAEEIIFIRYLRRKNNPFGGGGACPPSLPDTSHTDNLELVSLWIWCFVSMYLLLFFIWGGNLSNARSTCDFMCWSRSICIFKEGSEMWQIRWVWLFDPISLCIRIRRALERKISTIIWAECNWLVFWRG